MESKKVKQLNVKEIFNITGRGPVWVIDTAENGLSVSRMEECNWKEEGIMLGGFVQAPKISDNTYEIIGIEAWTNYNPSIGLLVKKLEKINPNLK